MNKSRWTFFMDGGMGVGIFWLGRGDWGWPLVLV